MREQNIQNQIRIHLSRIGVTNFRNNVGTGWCGKYTRLPNGDVLIKNARPLKAGLCKGSSDVIGITPVFITNEMVGKTLGVFTAVEVKNKNGKPTKEQLNFLQVVEKAGGFAGIAKSNDDIGEIINRY